MEKKKILITMLEVGFGHKSPAIAVKESLEDFAASALAVDVVDFARESGAYRDDLAIKGSWDFALAFPISARIGYLLMEASGKNSGKLLDVLFRECVVKGIDYIDRYQPDMIFATHPLCLYIAVKAREILGRDFKVAAYIVDPFDGYIWWANDGADALLVASEESRDRLLEHGIKPGLIHQMGFPIKKSFFNFDRPACANIISDLGLEPGRLTLLISAGGQGIGKIYFFAEYLYLSQLPINLIVVAGKNKSTKRRFDSLKKYIKSKTKLASLGYVTNMNELMCSADLVVGKAGASTAMEAIFLGKPFVFTEWATYNDRYIIQFALKYKIGWYTPALHVFVELVKKLMTGEDIEKYKKNLENLAMQPGTDDVALFLMNMLDVKPDKT
ncbi:MAG: glycosyltransferase [Spirochaetes bacterium]|nr:glycosyltransferase [Spirochaetota bacterium]